LFVIIMGGGRIGLNLASAMVNANFDVTLIEKDPILYNKVSNKFKVIFGKATNIKILEKAGISNADVFVATTANDEANLLACVLAKEFNPKKIIARVSDSTHEDDFKKFGIDTTINPELTASIYLQRYINRPTIADMAILGRGNAELLNISVQNKNIIGKKIGDVNPSENYNICAVYKSPDYEIMIPNDNMILDSGDKISI
jgi:trk system potassium uptake protein